MIDVFIKFKVHNKDYNTFEKLLQEFIYSLNDIEVKDIEVEEF